MNILNDYYTEEDIKSLSSCNLCPRKCHINRLNGEKGFCNLSNEIGIALICNHKGEEPILNKTKGICNVFFSHCNCQCIFCQNSKISQNNQQTKNLYPTIDSAIDKIIEVLQESENIVGFVSPTHQVILMKIIIRELHKRGYFPKIVYNSNGYDDVDVIKSLNSVVDVYIPDFKYAFDDISSNFSNAKNYPFFALKAIKEMYFQKGSSILTDKDDNIESGLIIRHLLLPEHLDNSKEVLNIIANEISTSVSISLMSQYNPPFSLPYNELNHKISEQEYEQLKDYFYHLGFHNGYFQELSSINCCTPDFDNNRFNQ